MVISIISLDSFEIIQKVYLYKVLNNPDIIITDANFLNSSNLVFITIDGEIYVINYVSGEIIYEYKIEDKSYRMYSLTNFNGNILFTK